MMQGLVTLMSSAIVGPHRRCVEGWCKLWLDVAHVLLQHIMTVIFAKAPYQGTYLAAVANVNIVLASIGLEETRTGTRQLANPRPWHDMYRKPTNTL